MPKAPEIEQIIEMILRGGWWPNIGDNGDGKIIGSNGRLASDVGRRIKRVMDNNCVLYTVQVDVGGGGIWSGYFSS